MAVVEQGVCTGYNWDKKSLKLYTEFLKTSCHNIGRFLLLGKTFTREGEKYAIGISRYSPNLQIKIKLKVAYSRIMITALFQQ